MNIWKRIINWTTYAEYNPVTRAWRRKLRIQRKRTKDWRMPEGAVYVGRPTIWGNPFTGDNAFVTFERYLKLAADTNAPWFEPYIEPLRGHDLACWCPLDKPCHADILLKYANLRPQAHQDAPGRTKTS